MGVRTGPGSRSMRGPRAVLVALAGAAVVVTGCSLLPWPSASVEVVNPELPLGVEVVTPPDEMRLGVSNQTAIPVTVEVNGVLVREMEPGVAADLAADQLPGLPWVARVRTESGRVLVELTVRAGDVWWRRNADGSTEAKGDGARVDLSCGRIDIWSGQQMGGPAPGPGVPGDCDP